MNKELVREFKKLTGYSIGDIAGRYGVSTQHIHKILGNYSLAQNAGSAYFLNSMINEKVTALEQQIQELRTLQHSIEESVKSEGAERCGEGPDAKDEQEAIACQQFPN